MMVLDTNIVLDLFVFDDPATAPLKQALFAGQLRWLVTEAMREELERVLAYPKIVAQLTRFRCDAAQVLSFFDKYAQKVAVAEPADLTCTDPDDQKFIDLALAHKAELITKDQALLTLARPLAQRGVLVRSVWA